MRRRAQPEQENPELERLLEYLKAVRGFDFTGYKRPTLVRRIQRRLDALEVDGYSGYIDYLEAEPGEFAELFDSILINVTGFFRDAPAWEALATEFLPQLLSPKRGNADGGLRVWIAGCSSGQEAYTVAMVLAEALGEDEFLRRVKIFATDLDNGALEEARLGSYPLKDVEDVPEELVTKYFERTSTKATFRRDLRRSIIFGRNDLVQDAPISRVDLLVCRNTLIYFTAETQSRILRHFNFSLKDDGLMFLGRSEMLITHNDLFEPVNAKLRLFSKVPQRQLRDRLLELTQPDVTATDDAQRLALAAIDAAPVAHVVFDLAGRLVSANREARELIVDGAERISDIDGAVSGLNLEHAVRDAHETGEPVVLGDLAWPIDGVAREFDVLVTPIHVGGEISGSSVTFADVTRFKELQGELESSKRELEVAYTDLQASVEELETTNEELQATNEELETTNEELQSTNEELETLNEELESTNEELETINDELTLRTNEVHDVNSVLEAILSTLGVGIAVVDRDSNIRIWSYRAEDLWGLRADEAEGTPLFELDIGLPVRELAEPLDDVLRELRAAETTLAAVTRRGRAIDCRVNILPLVVAGREVRGAIVLMEPIDGEAAA